MLAGASRWLSRVFLALFIALPFGDAISDLIEDNAPDDWIPEQHHAALVERLNQQCSEAARPPEALPAEVIERHSTEKSWPRLDVLVPQGFKAGVDPPPVNLV